MSDQQPTPPEEPIESEQEKADGETHLASLHADPAHSAPPEDPNAVAARESLSEGEEIVECPRCHNPRRAFLIIDGQCDSCRKENERAVFPAVTLDWPEVRQRRGMLLAQTDWSQAEDVPEKHKEKFRDLRARLRDVTQKPDPFEAWRELDILNAEINK
jgi:hypothetical protein